MKIDETKCEYDTSEDENANGNGKISKDKPENGLNGFKSSKVLSINTQRENKFWDQNIKFFTHGIPGVDKHGHSFNLRTIIPPYQSDIMTKIKNKMPEGFFTSQASFYRAIIAVGCHTILYMLEHECGEDSEIDELKKLLSGINDLGRKERLKELKELVREHAEKCSRSNESENKKRKMLEALGMIKSYVDDRLESGW